MDQILEQVQSGNFDPLKMFTGDRDQFLEVKTAIEKISNNLTKEASIEFLLAKIIPTAFDKTVSDGTRDEAIEIGFHLLKFVKISTLNTKDQEKILTSIEETYAKTVGELRDVNYSNWDKLWTFLIRLCHDKIHGKMSLANKLLRVLEVAFRNSTSIDQRLKAYDCWKDLIDNSSLNMEHMCSAKQIKLLVTPLRAKFSRTPTVINKRCDIFMYLLEKMQDKASLCLKEFLEFAFGPFEEKNDVDKLRQGKSVPEVCTKSTKVLIEILGHSHDATEKCIQSDDIKLYKPLISHQTFPDFAEILLNSVVECCVLLNEWNSSSSQNNIIIKCLWRSLLNFVTKSDHNTKKKCCIQLNNLLRKLLEGSERNEHVYSILGNVFGLLINNDLTENFKDLLFDIAMNLLCYKYTEPCPFNEEEVLSYVNSSNISGLIWPIRHFKSFKDLNIVNSKWTKLYSNCNSKPFLKLAVLQEMETLFTENPLLSPSVVNFLQLISLVESAPSKDFVTKFLRLIELVLTLPNISETDLNTLSSIILSYSDQMKPFYKSEGADEIVDKICACFELLLTIHKDYSILSKLHSRLKECQPKVLQKFSKRLTSPLEALMLNEDDAVLNDARRLMELLEGKGSDPDSFPLASTRSLRIMNMAKNKSKKLSGKTVENSALTLKTNRFTPKKKNEPIFNEDKSSDYVKIDTEVKLDVNRLNEHQKEVLRKRRDDIPALYSDLSQSHSNQDFSVDSADLKESLVVLDPKVVLAPLSIIENEAARKRRRSDEDGGSHGDKKSKTAEQKDEEGTSEDVGNTEENQAKNKHSNKRRTKQQDQDEENDGNESKKKKDEVKPDMNEIQSEETVIEENKTEEEKPNKTNETVQNEEKTLRKSVRQMNRKDQSYQYVKKSTYKRKKNWDATETVKTPAEEESSTSGSEEKKEEEYSNKMSEETPIRKSTRQQNKRGKEEVTKSPEKGSNVEKSKMDKGEDTIDFLITKMEKKIKEDRRQLPESSKANRRSSPKNRTSDEQWKATLEDGNQNKIVVDKEENLTKQEKIRQIVSKVKRQVMRTDEVTSEVSDTDSRSRSALEVYEFTSDGDAAVEESRKSAKKSRKKRFSLGIDDYVKKRKRKVNRPETLFHVTADCCSPVPLSKSHSLRAVSSPQESDTLTIVITRSPIGQEAKESVKQEPKTSPKIHIEQKSSELYSEDVIESSQPAAQVTTKKSPPGKDKLRSSPQDEETKRRTRSSPLKPTELGNKVEKPVEELKQARRLSFTESVPEQVPEEETVSQTTSLDKVEVDAEVSGLTKTATPETETNSEHLPDTLTLSVREDLPTSPVTFDTPDRTMELLNNTLDISPINSNAEEETEVAAVTPKFAAKEVSNVRVARLLQMVNSEVPMTGRQWFGSNKRISSPSTNKVKKMRVKKEENLDILTFSREVPSPLTVPTSGILKRKFSSLEESSVATPSPKRKRVNFSDPAITEEKIFIKESEEYDEVADQNSTKESQDSYSDRGPSLENIFPEETNKEDMICMIKDLCDSKLRDLSVDSGQLKTALRCLIQNLNVPEIVEIVTDFLTNLDNNTMSEVNIALVESKTVKEMVDRCILPLVENENVFDIFLPKLIGVLERLPDRKLECFLREIVKEFGEHRISNMVKGEISHKQAEEHVVNNFDCDKMKGLIQRYLGGLEEQKRNEFLADLTKLASTELPVNKEFLNWHVDLLQNFVGRMSD